MRIGHGYDAHRLAEGRDLVLGGVKIPHDKGLAGHSDADALAHAAIDALLGAAALGDIGQHFPPDDPGYKGADSMALLGRARALLESEGWAIENIDGTVIAQAPRLSPYIPAMRHRIADACGVEVGRVGVKATTEEGMGFTGRGEGVAAHCVALIGKREVGL
jgi:2-C-methyl-D-erythritol 2,4-cyclodiphosphate synthase